MLISEKESLMNKKSKQNEITILQNCVDYSIYYLFY